MSIKRILLSSLFCCLLFSRARDTFAEAAFENMGDSFQDTKGSFSGWEEEEFEEE